MAQFKQMEQFADRAAPVAAPPAVTSVLGRMRELQSSWPPVDGVAVFNRVYLAVTESIDRQITEGAFPDRPPRPPWT